MAPTVPTRTPDQQRTDAMRRVDASPDAFGAGIGRALVQAGGNIQQLGGAFEEQEKKQQATNVTDAYTNASKMLRDAQYDPEKGLLNRQGKDAAGITQSTEQTSEKIFNDLSAGLKTQEEKDAFRSMWARKSESAADSAAQYEFRQAQALRQETKTSALDNLQTDVVANYRNDKALAANFDAARAIIRTNADGLSAEGLEKLERQGISSLHMSVIDRLSQDNPGDALDYYEKHKGEIEGKDHAAANSIIKGVSNIRTAKAAVDDVMGGGPAISIYKAVEAAESVGNPDAVSDQGALGLMQLMPETAREVARELGNGDVAGMDDAKLKEFFSTTEGQKVNRQLGTKYLNNKLVEFDGDLEAALIAYNAGAQNARKFLNAGRDYSVLPKASETFPYVKKVMAKYLGVDLSAIKDEDGSKAIQDAVNPKQPGARYKGDSVAFLTSKLTKGKDDGHITGMTPVMRDGLAAMMDSAPDNVKRGLGILSGHRSVERQAQLWAQALKKYGSPDAARKWVAPPGNSQHNHGNAADLSWNGDYFSKAPADVKKWVHDNASRFGLAFPLSNEDWHIETEGARKGNRPTKDGILRERMMADVPTPQEREGTVVSDGVTSSPASIYSATFKPYTVEQSKADITDLLADAEDKYGDNPPLLAEVQRQIKSKFETQQYEQKQAVDQLQQQLFANVLQGGSVQDMPREQLLAVGEDNVGKLMKMEEKFSKAAKSDETDEQTYYDIKRMTPEEFANANLIDYADRLSKADLKKLADEQAALTRAGTKDVKSAQMRTRTQIVSGMLDTLGLDPKPGSDDAKTAALLDRALDQKIDEYRANAGKDPDAVEVQKLVDQLVLEGTVKGSGWISDDTKRVFELTPEERGNFYPGDEDQYVSGFGDIPPERQQPVANVFAKIYPQLKDAPSNEEGYVTVYNDMVRIEQGASPAPPDDLAPQIRQAFAAKYGRAPTLDEQAAIYRRLILKAVGQ